MIRNQIIQGSVLDAATWEQIPDEYVQCVVTSPPYWSLRDYGVEGQLGLEATPEEYIERMVEVFRHVRRVLRDDGTLWLNMGDAYVATTGRQIPLKDKGKNYSAINAGRNALEDKRNQLTSQWGGKPKDLCGMPWRLALALQADGWYLRRDIIWHKPNPMPESASDRCTTSHEYLFHLTKKAKYFYDGEAIKEPLSSDPDSWGRHSRKDPGMAAPDARPMFGPGRGGRDGTDWGNGSTRNKRSVWTIPTMPYKHAHFATFPPKLVEPCVLAGTSAKGCCPECGKPWVRVVEQGESTRRGPVASGWRESGERCNPSESVTCGTTEQKTTGWWPACDCIVDAPKGIVGPPVPCIVFDPFMGSGTVAMVAKQLGRDYLGIELNPEYLPMIETRVRNAQPPLFT